MKKVGILKQSIQTATGKITNYQPWEINQDKIMCGVRVFREVSRICTGATKSSFLQQAGGDRGCRGARGGPRVGEVGLWSCWLPGCQLPRLDLSFSLPKEKLACIPWAVLSSSLFLLQQFEDQRRSGGYFPGSRKTPITRALREVPGKGTGFSDRFLLVAGFFLPTP